MNLIHIAATRSLLVLAVPFLTACNGTNHQSAHLETSLSHSPIQSAENSAVLSELAIYPDVFQVTSTDGPQLVAGDWIAWQCAIAANYWDMPTKTAPAYAEAVE